MRKLLGRLVFSIVILCGAFYVATAIFDIIDWPRADPAMLDSDD